MPFNSAFGYSRPTPQPLQKPQQTQPESPTWGGLKRFDAERPENKRFDITEIKGASKVPASLADSGGYADESLFNQAGHNIHAELLYQSVGAKLGDISSK